jgi:hypothetical protein
MNILSKTKSSSTYSQDLKHTEKLKNMETFKCQMKNQIKLIQLS